MRYDISQQTPQGAPYQTGVTYKANGQPVEVPTCRVCRGELIGSEVRFGTCGRCGRREA